MNAYESSGQEPSESVDEQRAEWERFTMVVVGGNGGGYVNVRNDSHENPGEHIHTVKVEDGHAVDCRCAHAKYRDAHCKHQHAVEQCPLVVASADAASSNVSTATTRQQVATDGGRVEQPDPDMRCEECSHEWRESVEGAACPACSSTDRHPRRTERPDFGGGESTGVVDLE